MCDGVCTQCGAGYAKSQLGTARYMSPERARGDRFSHQSDVWSMGLVVGECALGRHMLPPTQGFYELFLLVACVPLLRSCLLHRLGDLWLCGLA